MQNILRIIKENSLVLDVLNVILGVLLVVFVVLLFVDTSNVWYFYGVYFCGIFINGVNSVRYRRDKNKSKLAKMSLWISIMLSIFFLIYVIILV